MNNIEKMAIEHGKSVEQLARDMLERAGIENAQSMTAGDLVEIANLIAQALQQSSEPVAVKPDFFQLDNGSDYWYECPDDEGILSDLEDITLGTEYSVFASHTYRQTYHVVKLPDENNDDTLVELVSSQRKYFTHPPSSVPLEKYNKLLDALKNVIDENKFNRVYSPNALFKVTEELKAEQAIAEAEGKEG